MKAWIDLTIRVQVDAKTDMNVNEIVDRLKIGVNSTNKQKIKVVSIDIGKIQFVDFGG